MSETLRTHLCAWENMRRSRALIYSASDSPEKGIDGSDVEMLYECLRSIGKQQRLDMFIMSPGGMLTAARRISRLLHEFGNEITLIVPAKARSAATLICLSANELIVGALGELSPLDPFIMSGRDPSKEANPKISSEEIRAFRQTAEKWFGLNGGDNRLQIFAALNQRFTPATLASFFRADAYVRKIGEELLKYQLPRTSLSTRRRIVSDFITQYSEHSHSFALEDLRIMGLVARAPSNAEDEIMREIAFACRCAHRNQRRKLDTGADDPSAILVARSFAAIFNPPYRSTGGTPSTLNEAKGDGRLPAGWKQERD
jgi:hypothetical protein